MSGDIKLMLQTDVVRVQLEEPRRNGLYFVPIFLMRKISHTCRRSSFFAKRHARLACSLVNALTTAYCRYHLFAIQAPSAHKYPKGSYRPHPSKPFYANANEPFAYAVFGIHRVKVLLCDNVFWLFVSQSRILCKLFTKPSK